MSRIEHRVAKVSLVTGLTTIMSVIFQLISVPVCLMYWGKNNYGSWLAIFSAFTLLKALDGGYVAYVGNKINYLYHQNTSALRQHLSSAIVGTVLIGGLQLLLAISTLFFYPLAIALGIHSNIDAGLADRLGLIVLVVSWVLTGSYFGIVHRLQIPAGLMFQAAWWAMLLQISQFVSIMGAAYFRFNMLQTALMFAIGQSVLYVLSVMYIKHKLPVYYPWWRDWSFRLGVSDLGQSMMLTLSNLIQNITTSGVVLIVAAISGPSTVPVFTTLRVLANLWTTVSNVLTTPLLPDVVRFHAKNETHKLLFITEAHWFVVGSAINWGVLLSYPLLPMFYDYWTEHSMVLDQRLLALMLASVILTNVGAMVNIHLNGINSLRIVLMASLLRGIIGFGGGVVAYINLGLYGFGIGIVAGELSVLFLMTRYFFIKELLNKGTNVPLISFIPVTLSAMFVLIFLLSDCFGWFRFDLIWPISLLGLFFSTLFGWKRLHHDVKIRIKNLFLSRIYKV